MYDGGNLNCLEQKKAILTERYYNLVTGTYR